LIGLSEISISFYVEQASFILQANCSLISEKAIADINDRFFFLFLYLFSFFYRGALWNC